MKGKLPSIVMVFVALALAFSLAAVAVPNTVNANPDELEWTEITIPEEGETGDWALANGTSVGPIAVSPDGGTIFAAVLNANVSIPNWAGNWSLMRSTTDGYSWKNPITKVNGVANVTFANASDATDIVDIVVSPSWEDDDIVLVATQTDVYISDDRGVEFSATGLPGGNFTSLDAAIDEDGHLAMLAGNDVDVYLKTWVGGWQAQSVGVNTTGNGTVLDVAFSPTYASDGQIVAVVTDIDAATTVVKCKFWEEAWGTITDATILDGVATPHVSNVSARASIGFPDDYDALTGPLFVGIQSTTTTTTTNPIGDVWQIDWSSTASVATDLNVRDSGSFEDTVTDIYSIAVSGDAAEATILAGTEAPAGGVPAQYLVHWSTDGGASWLPSVTETDTKQPTGLTNATVVMASPIAYVGTMGAESGFSASTSDPVGLSWNQRGLIDTKITTINDTAPSATYATDETLLMATQKESSTTSSLWRTTDEGTTWDRILTSTLVDDTEFDIVELCEGGIFVAKSGTKIIYRSSDEAGTLFVKKITAHDAITAWEVVDTTTIYTGDSSGNVWKTTNAGLRWDKPDESDITSQVNSIVVGPEGAILVGDTAGKVYICLDVDEAFEFERVGETGPCGTSDSTYVAFDVDYAENDMVYAGCSDGDIHRFIIDESTVWDDITAAPANGITVSVLVAAEDGALYALNGSADASVARTVNPTEEDVDDIIFEMMDEDLGMPTGTLGLLEVVPGSNILFTANTTAPKLWMFEDTLTGKVSLAGPADGSTSGDILEAQGLARIVLSWSEMEGADSYQYEASLTEDMESVITTASGYVEGVVKDVNLWLGTTYYWRVRVGQNASSTAGAPLLSQWSDTWNFTTPLGPGAARPELESPEAGEQDMGLTPVLEWTGLIDAINYELMVARDCDWTDVVVDKTGDNALGAVTTYAIPSGVLAYDTDYCWKVKALSETTESPWSDEGTFRTMTEAAAAEAVPTPAWVWVVIAIGAILVIALIVLIARTRRPV